MTQQAMKRRLVLWNETNESGHERDDGIFYVWPAVKCALCCRSHTTPPFSLSACCSPRAESARRSIHFTSTENIQVQSGQCGRPITVRSGILNPGRTQITASRRGLCPPDVWTHEYTIAAVMIFWQSHLQVEVFFTFSSSHRTYENLLGQTPASRARRTDKVHVFLSTRPVWGVTRRLEAEQS